MAYDARSVCFGGGDGDIACGVCMDMARDPVTLECGHTVCRSCALTTLLAAARLAALPLLASITIAATGKPPTQDGCGCGRDCGCGRGSGCAVGTMPRPGRTNSPQSTTASAAFCDWFCVQTKTQVITEGCMSILADLRLILGAVETRQTKLPNSTRLINSNRNLWKRFKHTRSSLPSSWTSRCFWTHTLEPCEQAKAVTWRSGPRDEVIAMIRGFGILAKGRVPNTPSEGRAPQCSRSPAATPTGTDAITVQWDKPSPLLDQTSLEQVVGYNVIVSPSNSAASASASSSDASSSTEEGTVALVEVKGRETTKCDVAVSSKSEHSVPPSTTPARTPEGGRGVCVGRRRRRGNPQPPGRGPRGVQHGQDAGQARHTTHHRGGPGWRWRGALRRTSPGADDEEVVWWRRERRRQPGLQWGGGGGCSAVMAEGVPLVVAGGGGGSAVNQDSHGYGGGGGGGGAAASADGDQRKRATQESPGGWGGNSPQCGGKSRGGDGASAATDSDYGGGGGGGNVGGGHTHRGGRGGSGGGGGSGYVVAPTPTATTTTSSSSRGSGVVGDGGCVVSVISSRTVCGQRATTYNKATAPPETNNAHYRDGAGGCAAPTTNKHPVDGNHGLVVVVVKGATGSAATTPTSNTTVTNTHVFNYTGQNQSLTID
ncbi:hypothetical protein Pelo_10404 [Pelomyxa schiedti]|nr:hypothetical protein Pelo_10404 [Pelomyxa schiedti]